MHVIDWFGKNRYVSSYAGEWIVVSGEATPEEAGASADKVEFHGRQREDAVSVIKLLRESSPEFWTVGIRVPDKQWSFWDNP